MGVARSVRYFVTEMISKDCFLLRILENFSRCEKHSSVLHVTKFPALQQILELCSDPNVVRSEELLYGDSLSSAEIPAPSVVNRRCSGRNIRNRIVQGEPFPGLILPASGNRHFRNFLSQRSYPDHCV